MQSNQTMDPLISVIVPVYNTQDYLERAVNSILDQTYKNIEILLVDDGSRDDSWSKIQEFCKNDTRVRAFHKENGGSSSARNLGIENALGEFFGFIDSDDFIEPEMYEILMKNLIAYQADIVQIGRDEYWENGTRADLFCVPPDKTELFSERAFLKELLLHKGDCSFCTKLIKKETLGDFRFPEGALNEDFHVMVKLLMRSCKIVSLPEICYHVCLRENSNTRSSDVNHFSRVFMDNLDNADMVCSLVNEQYPEMKRTAQRFSFYQRMDYFLHIPILKMNRKNEFYIRQKRYLRKNFAIILANKELAIKNKCYLTAFTIMPKMTRRMHRLSMVLRKKVS